jgi:hypothetical protein
MKSFVELIFFGLHNINFFFVAKSKKILPHPEKLNFVAKINKLLVVTFYFKHFIFSFRLLSPLFLFPTIAQKSKTFLPSLTLTIAFKKSELVSLLI